MYRYDFIIINRSFWPTYPVIGEALLRIAESLAPFNKVAVISQGSSNLHKYLKESKRGLNVKFLSSWAFSNSSSGIFIRILDMIFFMFWVLFCLIMTRPKNIYVSTDPPVLIPFIVAIFSKIMRIKYIYHIQDIHPEATNVVLKINVNLFNFLKKIDNFSLRHASSLITLNEEMKKEIIDRLSNQKEISIINNPSISFDNNPILDKKRGFSFTGNLGRPQRVPLIVESIKKYKQKGGTLKFAFAGGGIFSSQINKLSKENSLVNYHGLVSSNKAAYISSNYEWALLPIEDQITRYAFPSKISSYIFSGAKILAICSENTSVARWVKFHRVGIVVSPNVDAVVDIFFRIENSNLDDSILDLDRKELKKKLHMDKFLEEIKSKISSL